MMEEGGGGIQKVNNYTAVLHRPPDLAEAESSRAVRDTEWLAVLSRIAGVSKTKPQAFDAALGVPPFRPAARH